MERTTELKALILCKIMTLINECWGDSIEIKMSSDIDSFDDPNCDRVDFVHFDLPTKGMQPSVTVIVDAAQRMSDTIDGWHLTIHLSGRRFWIGAEQDQNS